MSAKFCFAFITRSAYLFLCSFLFSVPLPFSKYIWTHLLSSFKMEKEKFSSMQFVLYTKDTIEWVHTGLWGSLYLKKARQSIGIFTTSLLCWLWWLFCTLIVSSVSFTTKSWTFEVTGLNCLIVCSSAASSVTWLDISNHKGMFHTFFTVHLDHFA